MMHANTRAGVLLLAACAAIMSGCAGDPANPTTTRPVTALDPKTAEPGYWFDQPGVASAASSDFDELWKACKLAARDDGFIIDRPGHRDGLMTTQPLVSKQIFEPWRNDVVNSHDLAQSSLGTMRRTIHFELERTSNGSRPAWQVVPKVLVERFQVIEHRITNATEYRAIFTLTRLELNVQQQQERERDPASAVPPMYWYATGRDHDLERQLADRIRQHLAHPEDLQPIVPTG